MAQRLDKGALRPATRRTDGTVIVDARPTRAGVFEYLDMTGAVLREYRPTSEVFKATSLDTLNLRPVTNNHPATMVTAANARQVTVGTTGQDTRRDDSFIATSLVVYDAEAIADMEAGKLELSCGYECDLEPTPGIVPTHEPDAGKHYDMVQRNIRYNHVAIVDRGRAGPLCAARMDTAIQTDAKTETAERGTSDTRKVNVMDPEKIAALMAEAAAHKTRADSAESALVVAQKRADDAIASLAAAEAARDTAVKARQDSEQSIPARVQNRIKLVAAAVRAGVENIDTLDDRAIKAAIVEKVSGVKINAEHHDAYVDGCFDLAVQNLGTRRDSLDQLRAGVESARTDMTSLLDREAAAEAKMKADNAARYKTPGAN